MRGPARLLVDEAGNPVGVALDGEVYRLQVEALLTDTDGNSVSTEVIGTRRAQAVAYPELLAVALRIEHALQVLNAQLADITGEENPL